MPVNLRNILEGLTQLNPQASAQLAQRKSAAELLKQRVFDQGESAKRDARADQDFQLRKQEFDLTKQYRNWQMTPDDPNATSGPARAQANAGGSARNSSATIPAADTIKMFNEGKIGTGDTTTEMGTNIDPATGQQTGPLTPTTVTYSPVGRPTFQSGGQTIFPTTPPEAQATEAAGKQSSAKATAQGTQEGQLAAKRDALNEYFSTPEGEELKQTDPDTASALTLHSQFGFTNPKEAPFLDRLGDQYLEAVKKGDTKTATMLKGVHDTFKPPSTANQPGDPGVVSDIATNLIKYGPQVAFAGLGFGGIGTKLAAYAKAREMGHPVDAGGAYAAYTANKSTLDKLTAGYGALHAYEQTAGKNIDMFVDQWKKLSDTGAPWVNTPLRDIDKNLAGNPDLPAAQAARQVALTEVARVTNNPNLMGVLSDSARHEILGISPDNATLAQVQNTMRVVRQDMKNRMGSMGQEISDTSNRMGSGLDGLKNLGINPTTDIPGGADTTGGPVINATPPPGIPKPPAIPRPTTPGQKIDQATIQTIYNLAGKDPKVADQLARSAGWDTSH